MVFLHMTLSLLSCWKVVNEWETSMPCPDAVVMMMLLMMEEGVPIDEIEDWSSIWSVPRHGSGVDQQIFDSATQCALPCSYCEVVVVVVVAVVSRTWPCSKST